MSNGDKRYLGDVLIDAENYERQKQFFRDIIESYQWKFGGNFDASTLQDKGPEDFATRAQGERADKAILGPLWLGHTPIGDEAGVQTIDTDAVKLDRTVEALNLIDWYKDLTNDDVTDALIDIYYQVMDIQDNLDDKIQQKLDSSIYNNFIANDYNELKNSLTGIFEVFTDEHGEEIVRFNTDFVNGLRFILITQDAYDELPQATKKYWRNIFIIKDAEDIPPEYVDPMKLQLTDGYSFRVAEGYLQVNNGLSEQWGNICSLEDFINNSDFDNKIKSVIEGTGYTLNSQVLIESLKDISPVTINATWQDYPFLSSSLHDDFVETVLINGSGANVNTIIDQTNRFKTVDLDINTILNNKVDPAITNLNNIISTEQNKLSTAQTNISSLQSQIGTLETNNSSHTTELRNINSRLTDIQNSIEATQTSINDLRTDIGNWQSYSLKDLKIGTNVSVNIWNPVLKIAELSLYFKMHSPKDFGSGWLPLMKDKKGNTYNNTVVKALPSHRSVVFTPTLTQPIGSKLYIDGADGEIYFYQPTIPSTDKEYSIIGKVMYHYSTIQNL